MLSIRIRPVSPDDVEIIQQLIEIYRPFVERIVSSSSSSNNNNGSESDKFPSSSSSSYIPWITSFEERVPTLSEMQSRIRNSFQDGYIWIIAMSQADPPLCLGYAYCTSFRTRPAYRVTCEVGCYCFQEETHGRFMKRPNCRGVGRQLYAALEQHLATCGFRTALAVVASPNPVSERAHIRLGFEPCASLPAVAVKAGMELGIKFFRKSLVVKPAEDANVVVVVPQSETEMPQPRCDAVKFEERVVEVELKEAANEVK